MLPMTDAELESYRLHRRFDRMGRLVGDAAMHRLMSSHCMVVGLGGVGSFAVEALVRSGVGKVTIVDFDEVCITNFNRQLHAVGGTVGEKKAKVMWNRLLTINPSLQGGAIDLFYNERHRDQILAVQPDLIIDAIDSITPKCDLIASAKKLNIPIISSMGTGGKQDPSKIVTCDIGRTRDDPMARAVRNVLRAQFGFPEKGDFGVVAVMSTEGVQEPQELTYDGGKGFRCVCPQKDKEFFQCENRNVILGSSIMVTGSVGLRLASEAVRALLEPPVGELTQQ